MSDYDLVIQAWEAEWQRQHEGVRQMLYAEGRPDLVEELDAKMRDIRLGIDGARMTWHSISDAQRSALFGVSVWGGRMARRPDSPNCYGFAVNGGVTGTLFPIRIATVRTLCSRELMAWDGGAFDSEAAAVITERGLFVLKHGPPNKKAPAPTIKARAGASS